MRRCSLALSIGMLLVAGGCSSHDEGASTKTVQESDRLSQIQNKSGGDWSKLEPADKDYLVNTLAHGSESTAKMLLGPQKHR